MVVTASATADCYIKRTSVNCMSSSTQAIRNRHMKVGYELSSKCYTLIGWPPRARVLTGTRSSKSS